MTLSNRIQVRFYIEGTFQSEDFLKFADFFASNADINYQVQKLSRRSPDPYEWVAITRVGSIDNLFEVRLDIPAIQQPIPYILSLVFGNMARSAQITSIALQDVAMPPSLARRLGGPSYGPDGLRLYLEVNDRPLLSAPLVASTDNEDDSVKRAVALMDAGVSLIPDSPARYYTNFLQVEEYLVGVADYMWKKGRKAICFIEVNRLFREALTFARKIAKLSHDLDIITGIRIDPWVFGLANVYELAKINLPILCFTQMNRVFGSSANALISLLRYSGADLISVGTGNDTTFDRSIDIADSINRMRRRTNLSSMPSVPVFIEPTAPLVTGGLTPEDVYSFTRIYGKDIVFHIARALAGPLTLHESVRAFLLAIEAANRDIEFKQFVEEDGSADVLRKYLEVTKRHLP